jgi:hypothetical protein
MVQPGANIQELLTIRSYVTDGVTLPLLSIPPPIKHPNTPLVAEHADTVRARLTSYMEFGAVVHLPADVDLSSVSVQPLHVIIKPQKKARLVIDLSRNLNGYLQHTHFSYENVDTAVSLSKRDCWFGKLDLSNCFLSFPLHPSVYKHFIFSFEGSHYQFIRMPFGLSTAPLVCTQLLSVVSFALSSLSITHTRYLDDFLLIAAPKLRMQHDLSTAQQEIARFGLVINREKTEGPLQRITFLGVELDSTTQTLACPPSRITELTDLLMALRHRCFLTRKQLQSLIGKLSFAALVLPGARPFMRRMLDTLNACRSRRRDAQLRIDNEFRLDVAFWLSHLGHWPGRQVWRASRSQPFTFSTDASLTGFGFYLESSPVNSSINTSFWPHSLLVGAAFSGLYSSVHSSDNNQCIEQIAWGELLAVLAATITYGPLLRDQALLFRVDNQTDVHIINRQATSSRPLASLLRTLFSVALHYNLEIYAQHRPGVSNTLADFLSRPALHQHDHVAIWKSTYPNASARLSSVSIVYSASFTDWSLSSVHSL